MRVIGRRYLGKNAAVLKRVIAISVSASLPFLIYTRPVNFATTAPARVALSAGVAALLGVLGDNP